MPEIVPWLSGRAARMAKRISRASAPGASDRAKFSGVEMTASADAKPGHSYSLLPTKTNGVLRSTGSIFQLDAEIEKGKRRNACIRRTYVCRPFANTHSHLFGASRWTIRGIEPKARIIDEDAAVDFPDIDASL